MSRPRRILASLRAFAGVGIAALATGCPTPTDPPGGTPPPYNLVLVSIDTLRADRLGTYGYERPTSPNLDRLAAEGVVFEQFYQNGGATLPSHMTLLTSLHPASHGVDMTSGRTLPPERVTLAEQLSAAGYQTAGIVDGGWMAGHFGFTQGFERYDDRGGRLATILPKALAWVRAQREAPFFLFLHTYDVHAERSRLPYECPARYHERYLGNTPVDFDGCRGEICAARLLALANVGIKDGSARLDDWLSPAELATVSSLYDGCINYVDDAVAVLFSLLRELDLWDRTLIVVTSDHGEEFGEHGMLLHETRGYEEVARIPLILKLPDGRHAGRRVPHLAAMVDVVPTLLEILELPPLPDAQGVSLVPAIAEDREVRETVSLGNALRAAEWKWIERDGALYDLSRDPAERTDLAPSESERARDLATQLDALEARHRRERDQTAPAPAAEIDPRSREELRALGYLE